MTTSKPDERIADVGDTVEHHGRPGWRGWRATVTAIRPDPIMRRVTHSTGSYRLRLTHAPTPWGTDAAGGELWDWIGMWHVLTPALAAPAHTPIPDAEQVALW